MERKSREVQLKPDPTSGDFASPARRTFRGVSTWG